MLENEDFKTRDWKITDIDIPFRLAIGWVIKLGLAAIISAALFTVVLGGPFLFVKWAMNAVPSQDNGHSKAQSSRHVVTPQEFDLQIRAANVPPPTPVPPAFVSVTSNPPPAQVRTFNPPAQSVVPVQLNASVPVNPPSVKREELSIFRDKAQQIISPVGTHRIWIHDFGSETISVSIDNNQAVRIKKANGTDSVGDNKVVIYNDSRLTLLHVNSPRAPQNCCLIEAVTKLN